MLMHASFVMTENMRTEKIKNISELQVGGRNVLISIIIFEIQFFLRAKWF